MSHQLQQRLQKRFTTAARVKDRVSFNRVVTRLAVRNCLGDVVLDRCFDGDISVGSYANGGDIHIEVLRESVRRGRKV